MDPPTDKQGEARAEVDGTGAGAAAGGPRTSTCTTGSCLQQRAGARAAALVAALVEVAAPGVGV